MIKNITCIALFFITLSMSFAQNNLNDYKYIVVPIKFEFQKSESEYNLNALLKFLFEKNNFDTLMSSEALPEDLIKNGCLALKADIIDESNLLKTKMKIQLKNCRGEVVYTSIQGVSREKDYKKTYQEAIRMAFESIKMENYNYVPTSDTVTTTIPEKGAKTEIEKLKKEIKELKAEKKPKIEKAEEQEKGENLVSQIKEEQPVIMEKENKILIATLIPGSVFNYQLKNSEGQIRYTLLFSGKEDVFIVKNKEALVYKKNNRWLLAQYVENDLQTNTIEIQF